MGDLWTPGGLALFLNYTYDDGSQPAAAVQLGDVDVDVVRDDLDCADCGDGIEPTTDPARFLAANKLLNGGQTRCLQCMES